MRKRSARAGPRTSAARRPRSTAANRNHGSFHDYRPPRRALLARAVRHRLVPRARRRALPRVASGHGRVQEEGRAPHHHPGVHGAEGHRRRRHVPLHVSEGTRTRPCQSRVPETLARGATLDTRWIKRRANRLSGNARVVTWAARNPIDRALVFSSALRDASNAEAQVTTATRRVSNAVETDRARHAKPPSAKCAMKRDAAARETRSEGSGRRASERERRG